MPDERRVAAWIGASLVIEGSVASSEDTTIAGRVNGDVTVREHTLTVSAGGHVQGNIVAHSVVVRGTVVGTITAVQKVEIGATGSVEGDIAAPRMVLEEGAALRGRTRMGAPADVRGAPAADRPRP